jgi:DNA-binding transcriptional ArsR family regulator
MPARDARSSGSDTRIASADAPVTASAQPTSPTARPTSVQTLDRGLRVLELLARPELASGLTVIDLSGHLGVGRTVVYRLLETLQDHELVRKGPDGRWRLGAGLARLSGAILPGVRASATPVLRRLADEVGATAHLTLAEGNDAVAVVVIEPTWTDFHVAYRVGSRHPVEIGAAGKAIIAGRSGGFGAVLSEGELQPGAHGVAAALPEASSLEGSVGVVALNALDFDRTAAAVERAAREVADLLR